MLKQYQSSTESMGLFKKVQFIMETYLKNLHQQGSYNLQLFSPLIHLVMKSKFRVYRPSSYRAVNTFHLGYKNQSVYYISVTSRCLFSDPHKTHKCILGRTQNF